MICLKDGQLQTIYCTKSISFSFWHQAWNFRPVMKLYEFCWLARNIGTLYFQKCLKGLLLPILLWKGIKCCAIQTSPHFICLPFRCRTASLWVWFLTRKCGFQAKNARVQDSNLDLLDSLSNLPLVLWLVKFPRKFTNPRKFTEIYIQTTIENRSHFPSQKKRYLWVVQIIYAPQHWRSQWKWAFIKGKGVSQPPIFQKLFYYVSFRDQTSMIICILMIMMILMMTTTTITGNYHDSKYHQKAKLKKTWHVP